MCVFLLVWHSSSRVLAGAFYHSVCLSLSFVHVYRHLYNVCVSTGWFTRKRQNGGCVLSCNLSFTNEAMRWDLAHICLQNRVLHRHTNQHANPRVQTIMPVMCLHKLAWQMVEPQSDDKLSNGFPSWPYMACTMACLSHSGEEFIQHYMVICNERQRMAWDKLWKAQTRTTVEQFFRLWARFLWKRERETERRE